MKLSRPKKVAALCAVAICTPVAWMVHTWWFSPERQAKILVNAIVTGDSPTLAGMTLGQYADPRIITEPQLVAVLQIAISSGGSARLSNTDKSNTRFVVQVTFDEETKRGKPFTVTIPLYHTPRGWLVDDAELTMALVARRDDYRERWDEIAKLMTSERIPMIPYYRIGQALTPASITRYLADERGTGLDPIEPPKWKW